MVRSLIISLCALVLLPGCPVGKSGSEKALAKLAGPGGGAHDFGVQFITRTTDATIAITNLRKGNATGIAPTFAKGTNFAFKGGAYPGTGGTCGGTIASAASCNVVITYTPTVVGTDTDSLTLAYNDGDRAQSVSIAFSAKAQILAFLEMTDTPSYAFGAVARNSTHDRTFTVTNSGLSEAAQLSAATLGPGFSFNGGTCGTSLAIGASCTYVVRFAPSALGDYATSLAVSYSNGPVVTTVTSSLTGTAVLGALTVSNSPSYDYGLTSIGTFNDKTFTLTNTTGLTVTSIAPSTSLTLPFTYKGGSYPGAGGTCGVSLAGNSSCTFVVTFLPIAGAVYADTLGIGYFDGEATQSLSLGLAGRAQSAAVLTITDGPTYDFGSHLVGSSTDKSFYVINSGTTDASALAGAALSTPYTYKGGTYPGTGGTCGSSLVGGTSCSIVVSYVPLSGGTFNSTLQLDYFDGATTRSATRAMTGFTLTNAQLLFADTPAYTFPATYVNATAEKVVTINNGGGTIATSVGLSGSLSAPFSYKGGTYPGTGGTCGATVAIGGSCTLVVVFAPVTSNTFMGTVGVTYFDGATTQTATLPISGTGGLAVLALSDGPSYAYGSQATGSSTDKAFTVSNSGALPSIGAAAGTPALSAPYSFKGGAYPGTGGTCGSAIAGLASCTVVVTYAPVSLGASNDTVRISYNDGISAQTITRSVSGTGVTPASLAISDGPTYDYGTRYTTTTNSKVFTVTNSGQAPATTVAEGSPALAAPFNYTGGLFPGTGGNCTATIAGSSSCTISVDYAPTFSGLATGTIKLAYFNGASAQNVTRAVQGTGQIPATLVFSDSPMYDFGPIYVNSTADHTFTVTNNGDVSATSIALGSPAIAAPFTYLGGTYPGTGGNCGATLAAGATCSIVVHFAPTAVGDYPTTLRLTYNSGLASGQVATRPVTAKGVLAVVAISDSPSYDFGSQVPNSTTSATLTLTNSGGGAATALTLTGSPSGAFSFTGTGYPGTGGNCATTIPANGSCTIEIQFLPTATGNYSSSVAFQYYDGKQTQSISRNIKGKGVLSHLIISDTPSYSFGTRFVATSTDKSFTITNNGGAPAVLMAEGSTPLTGAFSFKGGTYPGADGDCSDTLDPATSCTIVVTFAPVSNAVSNATLSIYYSDTITDAEVTLPITGTGVSVASLSISNGATYNYGTQYAGVGTDKTFTVTNFGGSAATLMAAGTPALGAAYAFKGTGYPGSGGSCAATLSPGSSCTIVVTFNSPTAGVQNDTVRVGYYDGQNSQIASRAVTGTAVVPATLSFAASTYAFGTRAIGSTTTQSITITNTGPITATAISNNTAPAGSFTYLGGSYPGTGGSCGVTLASAATCTVMVSFTPSAAGSATGSFILNFNDGLNAVTSTENLSGSGGTPGTYDTSFHTTGSAATPIGSSDDYGRAVAVQTDNMVVVAGYATVSGKFVLAVARYTSAGALDSGFGTGGIVTTAVGSVDDRAYAVALQSDGKVVVAGFTDTGAGIGNFVVARYTTAGVLDSGFGTGGITTTSFGANNARAHGIAIQADGKIVAVGYYDQGAGAGDFALTRYTSAGALDATFGTAGKVTTAIGAGDDRAYAVDILSGNIVVAGYTDSGAGHMNFAVARYTSSGALDSGFNTSGYNTTAIGSLDERAYAVKFQSDGQVVLAGYTKTGASTASFALARYGTGGTLDGGFGTGGVVTTSIGTMDTRAFALGIQTNGTIYAAGYTQAGASDYDLAMTKYSTAGALDSSFGTSGKFTSSLSSGSDRLYGLAISSGWRLVGVGETSNGSNSDFAVIRVWP